jgi:hypothetical protein
VKIRIRQRSTTAPTATDSFRVQPATIRIRTRAARVLDFDIENRPLSYLGSDFTTAEVTAIAWAWTDTPQDVTVFLLGEHDLPFILDSFVEAYKQADMVTGHYIIGHDLPMINGALMECGMPALDDVMVSDTKVHLMRAKGISKSQESLGAMFHLDAPKVVMNQHKWRAANRLTPEGLAEVRQRVVGDVRQHIELRRELLRRGLLAPPRMWRSGAAKLEAYVP